jgi:predicted transcriptional regulator YdeE
MHTNPKLVPIDAFTVRGIRARTQNSDEADPSRAKLGALWGRFFAQGLAEKIPHRASGSPIYGVYSSYESDATGRYDLTAGVAIEASDASRERASSSASSGRSTSARQGTATFGSSDDFSTVTVEAGDYLVFEAKGPMPQVVIDTWRAIHEHFARDARMKRKYTTDFEVYRAMDGVAIHIAVAR